MPASSKPIHRQLESFLAMVQGSVGSRTWQHAYFTVAGKKQDLAAGGNVSCAFFVSSILKLFNLVDSVHLTVTSTLTDLERAGWKKARTPKPGCVLLWEPLAQTGGVHLHLGFYIGHDLAVSNDWKKRLPAKHHWTYRGKRKVLAVYCHPQLS